jgi:hypothetical protein
VPAHCTHYLYDGPLDGMVLSVVIDAMHPIVESIGVMDTETGVEGSYVPSGEPNRDEGITHHMKWEGKE